MTAEIEDRLGERHFPWHDTEFGVVCACGRPCDSNEACAVVRRVCAIFPPGRPDGGEG